MTDIARATFEQQATVRFGVYLRPSYTDFG